MDTVVTWQVSNKTKGQNNKRGRSDLRAEVARVLVFRNSLQRRAEHLSCIIFFAVHQQEIKCNGDS